MDKKNTGKLFKQYKFLNKKNMPDEFECEDGWAKLITNMCKELKALPPPDDFYVTKIANYFGELQVHTKHGNLQTRLIIDEYNTQSMEVCDRCGKDPELESCDKCEVEEIEYPDEEEETEEDDDDTTTTCNCGGNCSCGSGGGSCSGGGCSGGSCGTP